MPKRGSQSVRETNYKWLAATYGETCLICNRPPKPGEKLQIDEISYEPGHFDDPLNISLVCAECNCYLRPMEEVVHRRVVDHYRALRVKERARASEKQVKARHQGVTIPGVDNEIAREYRRAVKKTGADIPLPDFSSKDILEYLRGSSEMKANAHYYRAYAVWVWKELMTYGPLPEKDLLNSGANDVGANQTTLKRYLDGWTSRTGKLSREDSTGEWLIYFKDPVKARQLSGERKALPWVTADSAGKNTGNGSGTSGRKSTSSNGKDSNGNGAKRQTIRRNAPALSITGLTPAGGGGPANGEKAENGSAEDATRPEKERDR